MQPTSRQTLVDILLRLSRFPDGLGEADGLRYCYQFRFYEQTGGNHRTRSVLLLRCVLQEPYLREPGLIHSARSSKRRLRSKVRLRYSTVFSRNPRNRSKLSSASVEPAVPFRISIVVSSSTLTPDARNRQSVLPGWRQVARFDKFKRGEVDRVYARPNAAAHR
jgi:hypothetical protein